MLILNSSDARPRYVRDIATAVATPSGATFQFRYQSRYLAPKVQALLGGEQALGTQVCVCFVGNRFADAPDPSYLVPIRMGTIASVDRYGDAYVLSIAAEDFPDLRTWPRRTRELKEYGQQVLTTLVSNSHDEYYAAFDESGDLFSTSGDNQVNGWAGVVERLLALPTFESTFFLRVAIVDGKGSPLSLKTDDEGWVLFEANSTYRLRTWFYGNDPTFETRSIGLTADAEVLSIISDHQHFIRSRYDQVDYWFTPKVPESTRRTLMRVISSPGKDIPSDVATEVELRCLIPRPYRGRLILSAIAGLSATAVATPALLEPSTPLPYKLAIAACGALGVAVATGLR